MYLRFSVSHSTALTAASITARKIAGPQIGQPRPRLALAAAVLTIDSSAINAIAGNKCQATIVEFRTGDRVLHFKNWLGSSSTGDLHTSVAVLYDPVDPTTAMIDRPVMNWIPWAPCFVVGVFLVLVAIKGSLSSLNT